MTNGNCTSVYSEGYDVIWVGIEEQYAFRSLKVYPTPSQGTFTLELNAQGPDKLSLKIYNSVQTLVYEENGILVDGAFNKQFDLGNLPNGIYFMVLEGSNGQHLQKLVIRK